MILVSLFHTSPGKPSLLLLSDDLEYVKSWELIGGAKGIASAGKVHLVGHKASDGVCYVSALDTDTLTVIATVILPEVKDIHSLCTLDRNVYVVSSGTNRILVFKLESLLSAPNSLVAESEICPDKTCTSNEDEIHINAICVAQKSLFISAFGRKPSGGRWVDANDGYVQNITSGETVFTQIKHPHSLVFMDGKIWFCSSAHKKIYCDSVPIYDLPGYARGLALSENNTVFAGTSSNRTYDKSSNETSMVHSMKLQNTTMIGLNKVEILDPQAEIYDIVFLPNSRI